MCDCCDDNLVNLNASNDGQSAYLYIIYADDLIGTDAQLTVPTCFQAFVSSNVSMTNQEVIDYAIDNDLFYDRCGDSGGSGGTGPVGPTGPQGPAGDAACNPLAEISLRFLAEGEEEDLVIDFDQDGTECAQTFTGIVFPGNFAASSFFAEVLNSSQFENAVNSAVSGTFSWVDNSFTPTTSNFVATITGPTITIDSIIDSDVKYIKIGESVTLSYKLELEITSSGDSDGAQAGSLLWKLPSPIKPLNTVYNNYTRGGSLNLQMYGTSYCITNPVSASEGIIFSGQSSYTSSGFLFWGGTRTYILTGTITYKA